MRPLHSILLLIGLVVVVSAAWLTLRDVRPAVPAVAPAAAGEAAPEAATPVEVAAVAPRAEREARAVEPSEVAAPDRAPGERAVTGEGARALRGLVLDPAGQPVAGARVYAAPGGPLGLSGIPLDAMDESLPFARRTAGRTDDKGRFELRGIEPGQVRLAVRARGFAPWDREDVPVPAGGDHEVEPIQLERGAVVTGRVVDPDGRGIAGAELLRLVEPGGAISASASGLRGSPLSTTGADGGFSVDQLPAGSFRILVRHADHPDQVESGRVERPGGRLDGLTIVMEHGLTIQGRVTGAPPEALETLMVRAAPERGSTVRALTEGQLPPESREAQPAADGSFTIRGARAGRSYELEARRRSGAGGPSGLGGLLGSSLSTPVHATAGDRGVELSYQPAGAVVFQVIDASTGAPITEFDARAGVSFLMQLRGEDGRVLRQHPDGRARFGGLRPGTGERVRLAVSAVGYREARLDDLNVPVGADTDIGQVALQPVPLVEVTVLDDLTGSAVAGARVSLVEPPEVPDGEHRVAIEIEAGADGETRVSPEEDSARVATSDEQGVARLSSLEGERGVLRVRHASFAPLTSEPFVSPGDGVDRHVLRLLSGGTVEIALTTPDGEPLPGARIEHSAPGQGGVSWSFGQEPQPVTDADGLVRFEHLEPGTHRFRPAGASRGMGFVGAGGSVVRMRRSGGGSGPVDEGWKTVEVREGGLHHLALQAPVRVAVSGVVLEGGEPLEGARVSLRPAGDQSDPLMAALGGGGPEARTDARGAYRLERVESGEYLLEVTHPTRRMPASVEVRVADRDLERDLDLGVSVLTGRVTDEQGEPLAGVRVTPERAREPGRPQAVMISVMAFSDQDGGGELVTVGDGSQAAAQALTDEDGRYELRGVQPDVDLVVRAEARDVRPGQSELVRVARDATRDGVDVVLSPAGRIDVVATRPDGKPAGNVMIMATYEGEGDVERKSGFLQEGGQHTLDGLTPGPWRVTLRSLAELSGTGETAGLIPPQLVDVLVGETSTARFTVP